MTVRGTVSVRVSDPASRAAGARRPGAGARIHLREAGVEVELRRPWTLARLLGLRGPGRLRALAAAGRALAVAPRTIHVRAALGPLVTLGRGVRRIDPLGFVLAALLALGRSRRRSKNVR